MKKAILMRDVEGFSYEEIAKDMDCPIGTVRSRIFRGRQEVVDQMQKYMDNTG
jgi:RNA polymerase sigma-70 factor (ECF subfamily)